MIIRFQLRWCHSWWKWYIFMFTIKILIYLAIIQYTYMYSLQRKKVLLHNIYQSVTFSFSFLCDWLTHRRNPPWILFLLTEITIFTWFNTTHFTFFVQEASCLLYYRRPSLLSDHHSLFPLYFFPFSLSFPFHSPISFV